MPTSQPRSLTQIYSLVKILQPTSVVDIGVGHGKTGVLLREYLEIMKNRYKKKQWRTRIYGVEIFQYYRNPLWDYAYDEVYTGDAISIVPMIPDVDLVIALDVWEHFEPFYAKKLLSICLRKAKYVLICTPINPKEQGPVLGNPNERHISAWSPDDFRDVVYRLVTCNSSDWIFLLSLKSKIPESLHELAKPSHHFLSGLKISSILIWHKIKRLVKERNLEKC